MAKRRYAHTWDDLAFLDADHIASWGALKGYCGPIEYEGFTPSAIHAEHDRERDTFSAFYTWPDDRSGDPAPIRSTARIERRPQRFGGSRPYFRCPDCERTTLRLAILNDGLRCGRCGGVTWGSRREGETGRLVRRANRIAARLGLENWADPIRRPLHMRTHTFARLAAELDRLQVEITRRAKARLARGTGRFGMVRALATLEKWGL
jgi:hypothetical protein